MVHIKDDKLIIEFEHPAPEIAIREIQSAIINALQAQQDHSIDPKELQEGNYFLLELLKQTMILDK